MASPFWLGQAVVSVANPIGKTTLNLLINVQLDAWDNVRVSIGVWRSRDRMASPSHLHTLAIRRTPSVPRARTSGKV